MIRIRRHALVRHSPERMFDLVNDVEAYPTRFAWCAGAQVLERENDALVARLDLRLAGLTQSFTTRNTFERPQRLHMHLVDGPLRALEGEWTFEALGGQPASVDAQSAGGTSLVPTGCRISLALDFEYAGLLGGMALRLGFQGLANRMVDDFCAVARRTHG